ncbi:MAG: hypothetical protein SGJ09_14155 [Phycisphaerae bacterium]|nr:hypothetical protein [Phycisphaerae bacterium]
MNGAVDGHEQHDLSHDTVDRMSRSTEVLYAVIITLTFTAAVEVASSRTIEVGPLVLGILGCNLAWGIVDGAVHVFSRMLERGRLLRLVHAVQSAADDVSAAGVVRAALPHAIDPVVTAAERLVIARRLRAMEPPARPRLQSSDIIAAAWVCGIAVASTVPLIAPLVLISDRFWSLRTSNVAAIVMLFLAGRALGRHAGGSTWRFGLAMVGVGVVLSAIAVFLGG